MLGKGSIHHNERKFTAENVDKERSKNNVTYYNEDIKIVLNLIKQLQEEKVQANERCKQLESKEQKIKKKLEEKIEMLVDVLDLCETEGKIAKYKINDIKEEISDFKEILEIMKGEN